MNNEVIVNQYPTEYFANGNVKAYHCTVSHKGLDKSIKIRHRDFDEFRNRASQAECVLENEWHVFEKNKEFTEFYEYLDSLISVSETYRFDVSSLYKKFSFPPFAKIKPTPNYNLVRKFEDVKLEVMEKVEEPKKTDAKYSVKSHIIAKVIFPVYLLQLINAASKFNKDRKYYFKCERILKDYYERKSKYEDEFDKYTKERNEAEKKVNEHNDAVDKYVTGYKNKTPDMVETYFKEAIKSFINTYFYEINCIFRYSDIENSTLIIDFELPSDDFFLTNYEFKYMKTRNEIKSKELKPKDINAKIKKTYYDIYLSLINHIIKSDVENVLDSVMLNAFKSGIDKRTGKDYRVCLMTSQVLTTEFKKLELTRIDSRECFKYLKGKGEPNPDNIIPVKPVMFANKDSFRTIDSDDVLHHLSADTNLAAMDWRDFETLIKDVFALEFSEHNIEIQNTQHSNDGGVDVVAFNNDPYTGGIIVLQAKCYINTVNPEPVRALKGTMDEAKAVRGILVTTSDYGPSSRNFAANHNISLINGSELLELLGKHGFEEFHIDLEQARILNNET